MVSINHGEALELVANVLDGVMIHVGSGSNIIEAKDDIEKDQRAFINIFRNGHDDTLSDRWDTILLLGARRTGLGWGQMAFSEG